MKKVFLILSLIIAAFAFFGCKPKKVHVYFNAKPGDIKHLHEGYARQGESILAYINKHRKFFQQAINDYEYENPSKVFLNFKQNSKIVGIHSKFVDTHTKISPNYINKGELVLKYDLMSAPFDMEPQVGNFNNDPDFKFNLENYHAEQYTGYKFIGWYFDKKLTKPVLSSSDIKESCTIYARWERTRKTVKLTFNQGKEKPFNRIDYVRYVKKGEPFMFHNEYIRDPQLDKHKFKFWSTEKNPNANSPKFDFTKPITQDTKGYPYFEEEKHDTIIYKIPENKLTAEARLYNYNLHVYKGDPINKAPGFNYFGFKDKKFIRWELDINGKKITFDPFMVLDENKKSTVENTYTLEAIFQEDDEAVCKFDNTPIYDVVFKKGSSLKQYEQTIPDIDGKVFLGWFLDKELTKPFDFDTPYSENITLYPKLVNVDDFFNITLKSLSNYELSITSIKNEDTIDKKAIRYVGIPSNYGGYKITCFDGDIFNGYTNLEFVSIPNGISEVNNTNIFKDTIYLNKMLAQDKENIIIGKTLFKYRLDKEEYTLPEFIKSIAREAFMHNSLIKEVKLHDFIRDINEDTFSGCYNLEKINLEHIQKIKDRAFRFCKKITEANLRIVEHLGDEAFYGCEVLEKVQYSKYLGTFGEYIFNQTKFLENIFERDGKNYFVINERLIAINPNHSQPGGVITINGKLSGEDVFEEITKGVLSQSGSSSLKHVKKVVLKNVLRLMQESIKDLPNCELVEIDKELIRTDEKVFKALPKLIKIKIDRKSDDMSAIHTNWHNGYPVENKA